MFLYCRLMYVNKSIKYITFFKVTRNLLTMSLLVLAIFCIFMKECLSLNVCEKQVLYFVANISTFDCVWICQVLCVQADKWIMHLLKYICEYLCTMHFSIFLFSHEYKYPFLFDLHVLVQNYRYFAHITVCLFSDSRHI